jgi:hypothetical protein
MTVQIQNISVPWKNDAQITINVTAASPEDTLAGSTISWSVYAQQYGVLVDPPTPLLTKTVGSGITITGSLYPMQFVVTLSHADLAAFPTPPFGNYYHEALVTDTSQSRDTVVGGILTVTLSENT